MVAGKLGLLFKKLFHVYRSRLYSIHFGDEKNINPKINISFKPINDENYSLVKTFRGDEYIKEFKEMLNLNDFGLYVYVNEEPVGYGWAKLKNSKDYFYIINNCYLCRFFVSPDYRGLNIYPSIIKEIMTIINKEYGIRKFYIAVDKTNVSSINGITKVGFKFRKEHRFIRGCKMTLKKYQLS
ncbi:GNAT family N-acetyltransferase [Neobacillus sp. LXY-4]|uniref:GNAT family N-acetyltransferase n=1 Tax=Neobacillus sp. LXY-4 TaxID=3379826 RepID=UPI003EDF878C